MESEFESIMFTGGRGGDNVQGLYKSTIMVPTWIC